ncbi:MAG: four helix bundle protein [Alphaproteobacteria bacterium]
MTYEKLDVYQLAFEKACYIYQLTEHAPKHELYGGVVGQMRRSSQSICANVAEGLSKQTTLTEKKRFLHIALGSCEETRVWLSFCVNFKYIKPDIGESLRNDYNIISKMLYQLEKKLTF